MRYFYRNNTNINRNLRFKKFLAFTMVLLLSLQSILLKSQQYPVRLIPSIFQPYSLKLGDYATSTEPKLQLQLLMTDLMEPQHQTGLKFSLESGLNAVPLAVSNDFVVGFSPFTLYPGSQLTLSNIDVRALFELQNLSGINSVQYAQALPDGVYQFCFQAYDYYTKNNLSQKSCATVYLVQYDPPQLNLPQNGEKLQAISPYSGGSGIVFQWMPRQIAPNTKYIFTLKELWDLGQSPISGFLSSRVLWQEESYAPTLFYGLDKPQLMPGKRYAWQVQAKSGNPVLGANPTEDNGVYKNNGLTEIFYFDYVEDCTLPTLLMAKNAGRGRVELSWNLSGKPSGLYQVQYRRKGSNTEWQTVQSYQPRYIITGLEDQTEYEYRVGNACGQLATAGNNDNPITDSHSAGNAYAYSGIQYFTTDSKDKTNQNYQCGVMPAVDITNKTPLQSLLGANEVFMAGDFPVTVLEAQGSNGIYSGTGYIVVPYLADTKVKVSFNNIKLNTDRKLIEGIIETTYDPNETAVAYASAGVGELFGDQGVKDITIDYEISDIKYVATPPPGKLVIEGNAGAGNDNYTGTGENSQQELPVGKDYTIIDKKGNVWAVDEEGNVTKGGEVAKGGASTPENTSGVDSKGSATAITAKGIRVIFKNSPRSQYAFDEPTKALASDYKELNGKLIPFKAVENKKEEPFIASVELTDSSISADSLIFKTSKGVKIASKKIGNDYELTLKGLYSYATEEVQAVIKQGDKYNIAGVFNLVHISPKEIKLNLIPTTGVRITEPQQQEIKNIYKKIGIDVSIKVTPPFDISPYLVDGKLPTEDVFGDLSKYSPAQNAIISAYKSKNEVGLEYYLFVTDKPSSNGQNGYMRLNGQFGFVYDQKARTIAHELAHGALRLEHPFSAFKNVVQGEVKNLMDYETENTNFIYPDWKQINDPKFKLYTFQGQNEGEFSDIQLTPEWEPFKFSGSSIYISGDIKIPNGAVHGIAMCKNDDCSEKEYYYWINKDNKKGYYAEGVSNPLPITYLKQEEKDKNPAITLFWNYGTCGYNKTYTTNWNYIKDKIGFDLTKVTDENSIKYKETIPCVDGSGSTTNSEDICVGKDVAKINQGYNKVLGVIDSKDSELIVETINSVDVCSLQLLTYNEIEKLFKTLADDNNIGENKEKAIVRLTESIKSENFKTFFTLLESNGNELIKNLMNKLHDTHFLYGDNNYTSFVSSLLKMYKTNPESWVHYVKDENYFVDKIILANPIDKVQSFEQLLKGEAKRYYNTFSIDESKNVIIEENECSILPPIGGNSSGAISACVPKIINTVTVSPLSPILVETTKELPIIQLALDLDNTDKKNTLIVPAIFLDYVQEKTTENILEKSTITTLDGITIVTGGGVVLSGASKAKRVWALMEVVGAVGNIVVNTDAIDVNSNYGKAVEAYNLAMGIIGVKNIAQGGYKFAKNLPSQTKQLLQENKGIRNLLSAKYLEWNSLIMKYKSPEAYINLEVRKVIEEKGTILGQLSGKVLRKFNTPDEISRFLKTDKNGAFFWSGRTSKGDGVMDMALEIAQSKGGNTLEGLLAKYNIDMPIWDASNPVTVKIWEDVSALYATQVSGEVRAVLGKNLRPGNIWETVELPRLKQNPNVTKISTIDPETMKVTVIWPKGLHWNSFSKIKMKITSIDTDGWLMGKYVNGKLQVIGNTNVAQKWDYIIKTDGQILVGRKHSWLSQGEDVLAAGEIKYNNGKLVEISNASGHYEPTVSEALNFLRIFRQAGVNVDDATLTILDKNGNIYKQVPPTAGDRLTYY
nr:fibronectin type III domain-containing protein [Riemerella anatipestifer]